MHIFQPNLVYIVSQTDPALNVWDANGYAMTDAADQIADAFNWWRLWLDIGFGWGNPVTAVGIPEIETSPRNDNEAVKALLNPYFKEPFTIFLGKRERHPYGLGWGGNKIFIAYNYLTRFQRIGTRAEILQEAKTFIAHELGHVMGAQHNTLSPNDVMSGNAPDLSIRPYAATMEQIGQQYR